MDSKLRRMAIFSAIGVILLVTLLVIYVNNDRDVIKQNTDNSQGKEQKVEAVEPDYKAFLKDNTFFDQEENSFLESLNLVGEKLSLIANSIERDLRIQIIDEDGQTVSGQSFFVEIDGLGEYKDLDQDGVIYIADMAPGEYNVSLKPVSGYRVPENVLSIKVKEQVEYVAIDDISLLIKTEADIDAKADDTGIKDAVSDADKSEDSSIKHTSGNSTFGIDVSKWNGEIDWDKVKNAGVEFAIIRAGYRGSVSGSIVVDPYFETNMRNAHAAGVKLGVYFFTQAVNEVEAVEEASAVISLIDKYELDYPVYIDTEGAGGNGRADGLDISTRTKVCEAFCSTVKNAGYNTGVYASRNWFNNNLQTENLRNYNTWLAEYRSAPLYQGYYQMWQYTSKGKINGISGNVDLDICYE